MEINTDLDKINAKIIEVEKSSLPIIPRHELAMIYKRLLALGGKVVRLNLEADSINAAATRIGRDADELLKKFPEIKKYI